MIVVVAVGHAPIDVVMDAHSVAGPFAFIEVAETTAATGGATAIVVADQVIPSIVRVVAGADPGDFGNFGSWRAGRDGAATTRAKPAVEGAVAPVFAGGVVVALVGRLFFAAWASLATRSNGNIGNTRAAPITTRPMRDNALRREMLCAAWRVFRSKKLSNHFT